MTASLILTARMGSSRLPGKTLMKVGSFTILEFLLERLKLSKHAENLVVATSVQNQDDVIEQETNRLGVTCFRGSEHDVLKRVAQAANQNGAPVVVRLTGDCPLNDPKVIDEAVTTFVNGNFDLVTTKYNFPMGIDCEVLSLDLLNVIEKAATSKEEREHVTLRIWNDRERYRGYSIPATAGLECSDLVLTLDDADDLKRISAIVSHFGRNATDVPTNKIVEFVLSQPPLVKTRTVPRGF